MLSGKLFNLKSIEIEFYNCELRNIRTGCFPMAYFAHTVTYVTVQKKFHHEISIKYFEFSNRFLGSRAPTHYHLTNGFNLSRTALFTTSANKCVRLKIVQPTDLDKLGYEEKNTLLKRAQSPHLTIYKFPFPSMLSISHRFTGKNSYT